MLSNDESPSLDVQHFLIQELQNIKGVVAVDYSLPKKPLKKAMQGEMHQKRKHGTHADKIQKFNLSLPEFNKAMNSETVSLETTFNDVDGKTVGQIKVVMFFKDLINHISRTNWWKSNKAFLIDNDGNTLSMSSVRQAAGSSKKNLTKFGTSDPLEKKTLKSLSENTYGTVFGAGHPPNEIIGYYHLREAPWSLVLVSPGRQILESILKFRLFYFGVGLLSILSVVLFIRLTIGRTANAIKQVSQSAKELANGIFGQPLPVISEDEVGELTRNFNKMTQQLKERIALKEDMDLAKEVQQSLLPPTDISYQNMEISGRSVYCDETGGDFFDVIEFPDHPEKVCVAVGDVVGHGVGAALLMATTRALLRGRINQGGSLWQVMNDVNRLLYKDSEDSCSFVTMFLLMIDMKKSDLNWVRAGHDPAIVYDPTGNTFTALSGDGFVLGLDKDWCYAENTYSNVQKGTSILIGTDGVWEVENESKERFGKKRVEKILNKSGTLSAKEIVNTIISDAEEFRGQAKQTDDITLLVLKFV